MCLNKIEKKWDDPLVLPKDKIGWKVFVAPPGKNYLETPWMFDRVRPGKRLVAISAELLNTGTYAHYRSGFHIFQAKRDAENYWMYRFGSYRVIRKVRFNGITARVRIDSAVVAVAREMTILPEGS